MSSLITGLTSLEERWPGLFTFLRMANGHQGDMGFEGFSSLNEKVICDEEGLRQFAILMTQIMSGDVSEDEEQFLKDNGLVDPKVVEMKERVLALGEKLQADIGTLSRTELNELKQEYEELRARAEHMDKVSRVRTAQALEGMKILS